MQRQIIVVFLSLVFFALPSAWGADRGALFKVTAKGNTMFLFGTVHLGIPEFFPLEPKITAALASATTVALEVDPLEDQNAMMGSMMASGVITAPNAHASLSPEVKERLKRALAKANVPAAAMEQFRPWFVGIILVAGEYVSQGYRPDLSVDKHIATLAKANKVKLLALETPGYQLGLFNRMSQAEQSSFLDETLKQLESGKSKEDMRMIISAWSTADKKGLDEVADRLAKEDTVSGRFVKKVLLDERNLAMADKLMDLLGRESNTVAAIGTLHLIGANSIPELLSARGAKVERVY